MIKVNAIVGQSGGPTAAINATLAGVIKGALKEESIETLYGMKNGIEGFLNEDFVNLSEIFEDEYKLDLLSKTPSAMLGSCRRKLKGEDEEGQTYEKIFEILKKYNIRYFFYIGGNDSMDTVSKLSKYAEKIGYDLKVIGVPKTIDNDLVATDHTPGYASAAKFVATVMKELARDISVYSMKAVTIVEVMGRDAGWLTLASALPKLTGESAPDLIYLPECTFDFEKFINDIKEVQETKPAVLVAVSEGVRLSDGSYVAKGINTASKDAFGHTQLSGTARVLEALVKEKIGCKVRSIELSLLQRCAGHILSKTDIDESLAIGASAVSAALRGQSGVMMTFVRKNTEKYEIEISSAEISKIANAVKTVPTEYVDCMERDITKEGLDYIAPLVLGEVATEYECGMPKHFVL